MESPAKRRDFLFVVLKGSLAGSGFSLIQFCRYGGNPIKLKQVYDNGTFIYQPYKPIDESPDFVYQLPKMRYLRPFLLL